MRDALTKQMALPRLPSDLDALTSNGGEDEEAGQHPSGV
jgi:hypothetical protein